MRIGYAVEGNTDRAFLTGLRNRWCPEADLVEGHFRGSTHQSLRREFVKICDEFSMKGVDIMVFLTDGNGRPFREVQRGERAKFPVDHLPFAIHGVPDRNIECWICSDAAWLAGRLGGEVDRLRDPDPKGVFARLMRISRDDKKEPEIARLVEEAPLPNWLRSPSFEDFYEQVRDQSKRLGCEIENLRERRY